MKTRFNTAQTVFSFGGQVQDIQGLVDDGIDLNNIFFKILLGELEQFGLGLLHQLIHIHGFVIGISLNLGSIAYQSPGQVLLGDNTGMIFQMRGRNHLGT